jgi:hypothetical protein
VPTDINAMIRAQQNVRRVVISTLESVIIRGALSADGETSFGFFTSSIVSTIEYPFLQRITDNRAASHSYDPVLITRNTLGFGCFGGFLGETSDVLEFRLRRLEIDRHTSLIAVR